jgi:uncharacterized protein (UPF0261 family)
MGHPIGTPNIELVDSQNIGNGLEMNFGQIEGDDDRFEAITKHGLPYHLSQHRGTISEVRNLAAIQHVREQWCHCD